MNNQELKEKWIDIICESGDMDIEIPTKELTQLINWIEELRDYIKSTSTHSMHKIDATNIQHTGKHCVHMYSRSMNQPYPRLCIHCKQPETLDKN